MAGPATLVGRAAELAVLDRALTAARAGTGGLVLLTGPAGIGKSRLLEASVTAARERGVRIGRGYAVDDPGAPALWPWRRVVREWPGADALLHEPREPDAAARFELAAAFADMLRARARPDGLLVALEDLHWADEASVHVLTHLAAELATLPVAVVATCRDGVPGPLHDALPGLLGAHSVTSVALGALRVADVAAWLPALTGQADAGFAAALHARTGGNPLLVRLVAEDLARREVGPAGLDDVVEQSPHLRRVVAGRLAALDPGARDVVAAAAVVSERVPVAVLAAMLDRPAEAIRDTAGALLTTDADDHLRFEHALVRDAVYADLAGPRRVELHRRAAHALAALRPQDAAGSVAHHWRAVGGADAAAHCVRWARRADAQARSMLAFDDAVRFAELAVAAARDAGAGTGELAALLVRHAEALYLANYLTAAIECSVAAADAAEAAGRTDLLAAAALVVQGMGDPYANSVVPGLCSRALDRLPPEDHALRARLLAQVAIGVAEMEGGTRAGALAADALAEAERSGDGDAVLEALAARHLAIAVPDTVQERLDLGRRAVALGHSRQRPIAALWGHLWRVDAAFQLGNLAEVQRETEEIERVAIERGSALARWHHYRCLARRHSLAGAFDKASAANDAARELGRRVGDLSMDGMYFAFRVQLSWLRGVVEVGPGWFELMAHAPPMPLIQSSVPLVHAVGGDVEQARAEFEPFRHVPRAYPFGTRWLGTVAQIAIVAVELGDEQVCADAQDLLAPYAHYFSGDGSGAPFSFGSNALLVADAARVCGHTDDALRYYADAVAMNTRIGARPFTALARFGWAAALLAGGHDLAYAADLARQAAAEFRRLGMTGRLPAATDLAGRIDARTRSSSPLSTRETEVAALVAEALSNREIAARLVVSERTVESHVRSVLAKLGLRTRTEIVAWSLRRPP